MYLFNSREDAIMTKNIVSSMNTSRTYLNYLNPTSTTHLNASVINPDNELLYTSTNLNTNHQKTCHLQEPDSDIINASILNMLASASPSLKNNLVSLLLQHNPGVEQQLLHSSDLHLPLAKHTYPQSLDNASEDSSVLYGTSFPRSMWQYENHLRLNSSFNEKDDKLDINTSNMHNNSSKKDELMLTTSMKYRSKTISQLLEERRKIFIGYDHERRINVRCIETYGFAIMTTARSTFERSYFEILPIIEDITNSMYGVLKHEIRGFPSRFGGIEKIERGRIHYFIQCWDKSVSVIRIFDRLMVDSRMPRIRWTDRIYPVETAALAGEDFMNTVTALADRELDNWTSNGNDFPNHRHELIPKMKIGIVIESHLAPEFTQDVGRALKMAKRTTEFFDRHPQGCDRLVVACFFNEVFLLSMIKPLNKNNLNNFRVMEMAQWTNSHMKAMNRGETFGPKFCSESSLLYNSDQYYCMSPEINTFYGNSCKEVYFEERSYRENGRLDKLWRDTTPLASNSNSCILHDSASFCQHPTSQTTLRPNAKKQDFCNEKSDSLYVNDEQLLPKETSKFSPEGLLLNYLKTNLEEQDGAKNINREYQIASKKRRLSEDAITKCRDGLS
ncbi:uncharacterized protein LOC126304694 isoform X2 [Schistocerca gregaria]|uniref:uncharacterized protein LOC126304694 isoform X2 n=1 Tax=Schistocerca gregaria TaxID=7010 RepID=UPI00211DC230|nr:uncharacterized protein LOC126304694 isoform X2 [Schistocerca gregaria]